MEKYKNWKPTAFDSAGAFLDDRDDWLVAPVIQTRDSGPYELSNFAAALETLGGEVENKVEVHRFGHWGPGWFEIILAVPELEAIVADIEKKLLDYPLLDEDDYYQREHEDALESWDNYAASDFKKYLINQFGVGFYSQQVVEDNIDNDKLWEFYSQHANCPYESDSSGADFRFENNGIELPMVAALIRENRKLAAK